MNIRYLLHVSLTAALVIVGCERSSSPAEPSEQTAPPPAAAAVLESSEMVDNMAEQPNAIDAYVVNNIDGTPISLAQYSGKVLLIVNVASKCGYTPQYAELEQLWTRYKDRGLVVLGFPANNFGGQEPGSDEQIKQFCTENYGVTFPMFSKVSVKGQDIAPLFALLTEKAGEINWNFNKFLIDRNGNIVTRFDSKVTPLSENLTSEIEKLL